MSNLKQSTEPFQGIVIGEKASSTKAIIIALSKADLNLLNITTPNNYTPTLTNVFDTSVSNDRPIIKKHNKPSYKNKKSICKK